MARQQAENKIATLVPVRSKQQLINLDALDKQALLQEDPISLEEAAKLLGVGKQKVVEFCLDQDFPLPSDKIADKWVLFPTLVRWWRLNRQKVQ